MERATVMKTFHGSLTTKSSNLRDRDASFSSYLRSDEATNCQRHLAIGPGRCRATDDSTTELSIFDAHKYFNDLSNNDIQKVTISSNSRVSPLVHVNLEHNPERGDIREMSRYSSTSSSVDAYANIRNYRASSFHAATPTASSEASWNSQTGLLSHPPGAIAVSMRRPPHPTDSNKKTRASLPKSMSIFRRNCPCSGKKSVQVEEKKTEPKTQIPPLRPSQNQTTRDSLNLKGQGLDSNPKTTVERFALNMETAAYKPETSKIPVTSTQWVDQRPRVPQQMFVSKPQRFQPAENPVSEILQSQRALASARPFTDGFTFPVLNPQSANSPIKLQVVNGVDEDPPRDSLEVFQPSDVESTSVSQKSIDKDRQNFPFPPSPKTRIIDDDVASDASSDLFEIESFSTQTTSTYPMIYRRRDSLDEISNFDPKRLGSNNGFLLDRPSIDGSMTPTITECYEPSEASIDWSVTTAEGFDRASVANFSVSASEVADDNINVGMSKSDHPPEKCKQRSSSGNGLLSCRCEKAVSVGPQPVKCVPAAEGHSGATSLTSKHTSVSSRPAANVNKAPIARSHTARMSVPFAT
ncbi:hypothetical protein L6164_009243 [Bauhinia variegata]|uniref:Uncharacterized protein n=1 Tax=Bauhinia variegata TaxID=167791 RepID=A0ACB9PPQ3_BAUVA|nr:hypothetical protein L6164_009243 [Bauhinia variegata]